MARILLYDIETSPNVSYTWGKYEQNVIAFVKERQIISFAWKWYGEKTVHVLALPSFPGYKKNPDDNKKLVVELHALISKADLVVAHNGSRFDDKMANTEFIKHRLKPPPPYKCVDTLRAARSKFRFNSNRLDDLGEFLGLGRKAKHEGFGMWLGCLGGDMKAWRKMMKYNKQDVVLLERVYLTLRPWTTHPDLSNYSRVKSCPVCESKNIREKGWSYSATGKRRGMVCMEEDCGKRFSGAFTKEPKS